MITIELPSGKYLAVTVPEGANTFRIDESGYFLMDIPDSDFNASYYPDDWKPSGSWQLLGLAKDLKEDDWKKIVRCYGLVMWTNYTHTETGKLFLDTATESGLSLLSKHNLKPETTVILKQSNI